MSFIRSVGLDKNQLHLLELLVIQEIQINVFWRTGADLHFLHSYSEIFYIISAFSTFASKV